MASKRQRHVLDKRRRAGEARRKNSARSLASSRGLEELEQRLLLSSVYVAGGSAPSGDGSAEHPYDTIAQAVLSAHSGDIVDVAAGDYSEAVTIPSGLGIDFQGDCRIDDLLVANGGTLWAEGDLFVAGDMEVRGAANLDSACVFAGGAITMDLPDQATLGGQLRAAAIDITSSGKLTLRGRLQAPSIVANGTEVWLEGATLDADGPSGGLVLVGQDSVGASSGYAARVYVSADSVISADGDTGDGGRVIVRARDAEVVAGSISAGGDGGQGGFVETSAGWMQVTAAPDIHGQSGPGQWLIDPYDITIVDGYGDTNINASSPFAATGNTAQLGVGLLRAALSVGNVTVSTGAGGAQNGDITLAADLDFNGITGVGRLLTLTAARNITLTNQVYDSNPGDGDLLNLTLTAGAAGAVAINNIVSLGGGSFTTTGATFDNTGGAITTSGAGTVNITDTGNVTVGAQITAGSGAVTVASTGGNVIVSNGDTTPEIISTGAVNATGYAIGSATNQLDLQGATSLNVSDQGPGDIYVREVNSHTITSTAVNVAAVNDGNINITYVGGYLVDVNNNATSLELHAVTLDGAFSFTGYGPIIDSGTLSIAGATSFITRKDGGASITLTNASSTFGALTLRSLNTAGSAADAGAIQVYENANMSLALAQTTSSATLSTPGTITQTGAITCAAGSFTSTGTDKAIGLSNGGNAMSGSLTFSTVGTLGNVTMNNGTTAVSLGSSTINGSLSITAAQAIGQTAAITVTGTGSFTTTGAAHNITLGSANAITGAITFSTAGGNATINNGTTNTVLATSTVTGLISVTTGGTISQSGALTATVTGSGFTTNVADKTITLSNGGNALAANVAFSTLGTLGNATWNNGTTAAGLAASTINGNLSVTTGAAITQAGAITVTGTGSFTTTGATHNITLSTATNAITGAITLFTASGNATINNGTTSTVLAASTVTGLISVTTGGTISQSGALTATVTGSAFTTNANDKTINLSNVGNAFTGNVSFTTQGTAANVTWNNGVTAAGLAASAIHGNLSVTTAQAITQSGAITVTGTTGLTTTGANHTVTLGSANTLTGAVTLSIASGNATLTNGATNLVLASGSVGGSLTATSGGTISQTGPLTVTATGSSLTTNVADKTITLSDAGNAFTGTVAFSTLGTVGHVQFNSGSAVASLAASTVHGNLSVTAAQAINQSGVVTVTGTGAFITTGAGHDITLNTSLNAIATVAFTTAGGNVALNDGATNVSINASTIVGSLLVTTTGTIGQGGAISCAAGTFSTTAADKAITLGNAGNAMTGTLIFNTMATLGHVTLNNGSTAVSLGGSTINGSLSVTTGQTISQSGVLTVSGTAGFTVNASGYAINLGSANAVTGAVSFATSGVGGDVTFNNNATAIVLGSSSIGGNLTLNTAQSIGENAAVTVSGTSGFTTTGANHSLTLGSANALGGAITLSIASGNATVNNGTTNVVLATSSVGGWVSITTGGTISQSGTLTATSAGSAFTTNVADKTIDLSNAGNAITGTVAFSTLGTVGHVTWNNGGTAVMLAASTINGNFLVTTAQSIGQSGALTVSGTGAFTTTGAAHSITLGTTTNAITGAITLSTASGDATLNNGTTAITLAASGIGGNLNLTSGAAIGQAGTLTVSGTGSFTTTGANHSVTLGDAGNAIGGTITLSTSSGNVTLNNGVGNVVLAASSVGGWVAITTGGAISQSGALTATVAGSGFTTNVADETINLSNAGNAITGTVAFNTLGTAGHVTFNNGSTAVSLGSSTVNGNLSVTTAQAIGQSAAITVGGTGTFTTTGAAHAITLGSANAITGTVVFSTASGDATFNNGLLGVGLGASSIGGNLSIQAGGAISQSGVLTVSGTAGFTVNASGYAINLGSANAVTGAVSFATSGVGGDVTFNNNATAIMLGSSSIGGNLTLNTAQSIGENAAVTVSGTSGFTTTGANHSLTLGSGNALSGAIALSVASGNATINNGTTNVVLATSSVGGWVSITTGGTISQSGTLTATSAGSAFTTNVADKTIDLSNAGNAITGTVAFSTLGTVGHVTFNNGTTAVSLGGSTVNGNLSVTTGQAIGQSAAITVSGTGAFTTTGAGHSITLSTTTNAITGAITLSTASGDATVNNGVTAITLAASGIGGNLNLTSGAGVTIAGATSTAGANGAITITVGGAFLSQPGATIASGSGAISITAADVTLQAQVSGTEALWLLPSTAGASIGIGGGAGAFNLSTADLSELADGFSGITIGQAAGTHAITIGASSFSDPLTIRTPSGGSIHVDGTLTGTGDASVHFQTPLATLTTLNADIVTHGGAVVIDGAISVGDGDSVTISTVGGAAAGADITLSGAIDGDATTSAPESLTLAAGVGNVNLAGAVGATNVMGNLGIPSASAATLHVVNASGDVTVTAGTIGILGAINAGGMVHLSGDVALSVGIAAGADITLDSGNVTAGGNIVIASSAGAISITGSIRPDSSAAGRTLSLSSGVGEGITVAGVLGDLGHTFATVTVPGAGWVSLAGVAAAGDLSFTADNVTFVGGAGSICSTGGGNLLIQPTTDGVSIDIGSPTGGTGTMDLSDADLAALANGFAGITIGRATGQHVIHIGSSAFTDPVVIRTPLGGSISVDGVITCTDDASVRLEAPLSTTTLNSDITTVGKAIQIDGPVVIGDDLSITLDTTGGAAAGADITLGGTVDGDAATTVGESLALVAGVGAISLQGIVGGVVPLDAFTATSSAAVGLPAISALGAVDVTGGSITADGTILAGSIDLSGNVVLEAGLATSGGHIVLDSGSVELAGTVSFASAGGDISVAGSILPDSAANGRTIQLSAGTGTITLPAVGGVGTEIGAMTILSAGQANLQAVRSSGNVDVTAGTIRANGAITAGGSVDLSGDVLLNAGITTAGRDITLDGGNVTLGASVLLSSGPGAGDITLDGPVMPDAAAQNRTLQLLAGTGAVALGSAAGSDGAELGALTITSAASATLAAVVTSGAIDVTAGSITAGGSMLAGGAVTLMGPVTLGQSIQTQGGAILITGNVALADNASVGLDTTAGGQAGADITITGTSDGDAASHDGGESLTLTAGTGTVRLESAVGGAEPMENLVVASAAEADLVAVTALGNLAVTADAIHVDGPLTGAAVTLSGDVDMDADITAGSGLTIQNGNVVAGANLVLTNGGGTGILITGGILPDFGQHRSIQLLGGTGDVTLQGLLGLPGQEMGSVVVTTTAAADLAEVDSNSTVQMTAGTIDISGDITASGAVHLTGDVSLGANLLADGWPITLDGGDVTLVENVAISTGAGGDIAITGPISCDSPAQARQLDITAGTGDLALLGAIGSPGGELGSLVVHSAATADIPAVNTSAVVTVTAGAMVVGGDIVSGGAVTLTGDITLAASIQGSGVTLDGDVTLAANASLTAQTADVLVTGPLMPDLASAQRTLTAGAALGQVTLSGPAGASDDPLGSLTVQPSNLATLHGVYSDGAVTVTADTIDVAGAINAGGAVHLTGDVLLGADIVADHSPITLDGGDVTVRANVSLSTGTGGDIHLTGDLGSDATDPGRSIILAAGTGAVTLDGRAGYAGHEFASFTVASAASAELHTVAATGEVAVTAGTTEIDGITAGSVSVACTGLATLHGITSDGAVDLVAGSLVVDGVVTAGAAADLTADDIALSDTLDAHGAAVHGNAVISAPVYTEGGDFRADGGTFDNTGGAINSGSGDIVIDPVGLVTLGAPLLHGAGTVSGTASAVHVISGGVIQNAIDISSAGATVTVYAGSYPGAVKIGKALTLLGAEAGVLPSTRTAGGAAESIIDLLGLYDGVSITAGGVIVDGFDIIGDAATNYGIHVAAGAGTIAHITLRNNFIHGMSAEDHAGVGNVRSYGVLADARGATFGRISDLRILNNSVYSIGGTTQDEYDNAAPTGQTVTSAGRAVELYEVFGTSAGAGATIQGNAFAAILDGSTADSTVQSGVCVQAGLCGTLGSAVTAAAALAGVDSGVEILGNQYGNAAIGAVLVAAHSDLSQAVTDFTSVPCLAVSGGSLPRATVAISGRYAATEDAILPDGLAQQYVQAGITQAADAYFTTIQGAIDRSNIGAAVLVTAGTYVEDLVIPTNGLELASIGGAAVTTIQGIATTGAANVDVRADGVIIHGFTFAGPAVPAAATSGGLIVGGSDVEIYDNAFVSTGSGSAVAVQSYRDADAGYDNDISGLSIHDNAFSGDVAGGYTGVFLGHTSVGSGPGSIADNTFAGNLARAVVVERSNTTISGNTVTGASAGTGITAADAAGRDLADVSIQRNSLSGLALGVVLGGAGESLSDVLVQNNRINGNATGIHALASAGVTIGNNSLSGNTLAVENDAAATLDASGNWWGIATVAGVNALCNSNVDVTPWLDGGGSSLAAPGFAGDFSRLHVGSGPQSGSDGRVQEALDLVTAGGVVLVHAGTYVEDIVIATNGVELAAPDGAAATGIVGVGVAGAANVDIRASGVSIHGFTIASPAVTAGQTSAGMMILGDDVAIYGNTFVSSGTGSAVAIQTYRDGDGGAANDISGLSIHDNTFGGTITGGYTGIKIAHADLPSAAVSVKSNTLGGRINRGIWSECSLVNITQNTLTGDGGVGGQGVVVADDDDRAESLVVVDTNTITGFDTGVVLGDSAAQTLTGVALTGCTISGNRLGVLVQSSAAALSVHNNNILDNTDMGLSNQDQGTLDACWNWWGDSSGPAAPTNPNGKGNSVSARVLFIPWTGTLRPDLVGRFTVVTLSDAIVDGDTGSVTFVMTNQGTLPADGKVESKVYITSASASVLLCIVTGRINLGIGQSQTFTAKITVPTDLTPGTYTITGAVDTANDFVELDETNNGFAEARTHTLDWLFGAVGDRTNVPLTVKDATGRNVTFTLTNGGTGSVTVEAGSGLFNMDISDTLTSSILAVKPTTGNTTGLYTVNCAGPLASFNAPGADLDGSMTISGGVNKVALRSCAGRMVIGNDAALKGKAFLTLGNVDGLSLLSDMPLGTLWANQWLDDSGDSAIVAPSLGGLQIGGGRAGRGDFAGDVTLRGAATGWTLGRVSISGDASGQWTVGGRAGSIDIGGLAQDYHLAVSGNVASLALAQVATSSVAVDGRLATIQAANWAGGSLEADVIGALTIGGDFGANLTIDNARKAPLALGTAGIRGWLENATVNVAGNVNAFIVGGMRDAAVYAGILPNVSGLPMDASSLAPGTNAAINQFVIRGVRGQTYSMINSDVAAYALWDVRLRDAQMDNSANGHQSFGVAANILASVQLRQGAQNYSWPNLYTNCWLPDPMDLKISPLE